MITVERLKLAFFPVPKCACSSAKHVLYELNHGHAYQATEGRGHIHKFYQTGQAFVMKDWQRAASMNLMPVCLVRDPLQRLRSAYTNRVRFHGEINDAQLARAGITHLPAAPSFNEFACHLFEYQSIPSIRHHTLPMVNFLGSRAEDYSLIFNVGQMERFYQFLDSLSGSSVNRHHRQQGGADIKPDELSPAAREKVIAYYQEDYTVFGKYIFA